MIEKGDLGMYDINQLLKNVHGIDKASYNKTLAENLYREYKSETNK